MARLSEMRCTACRGGEPTLTAEQIETFRTEAPEWSVVEADGVKRLDRVFRFAGFSQAVAFTDEVAALAEAEAHHPRMIIEWGAVTVQWWTHKIRGLHQNDFIMAAKTDQAYETI